MTMGASSWRSRLGNTLALLLLVALAVWLLRLQSAPWPGVTPLASPRWFAGLALVGWCSLALFFAYRGRSTVALAHPGTTDAASWRVVHASQTGFALELAQRTVQALQAAGCNAQLFELARLAPEQLQGARCLFVVSTTGEGDPPDAALGFAARTMTAHIDLHDTQYAVLALGDRSYVQYCAFGQQLDAWLRGNGAQPLFDRVEVDNADPAALRHWQHQIGVLTGDTEQPDWDRPHYQPWTLAQRRHLNPGSAGGPTYHLALQPHTTEAGHWQPGDIAEIGPRNARETVMRFLATTHWAADAMVQLQGHAMPLVEALVRCHLPESIAAHQEAQAFVDALQPLPHREYSIASIPTDGYLELLVRLMHREDGSPGIGSGWLCDGAAIGSTIDLRIRSNPNFHPPRPETPLILIGNGTGLAGLRAHLKQRIAHAAHRNWLLFGERNAAHDAYFDDELSAWLSAGQLAHLDRVYSRDGGDHRYVQDVLHHHAARLQAWMEEGAAVYVCGSLQGMAPGVDAALTAVLGADRLASLLQEGRYRRDVY